MFRGGCWYGLPKRSLLSKPNIRDGNSSTCDAADRVSTDTRSQPLRTRSLGTSYLSDREGVIYVHSSVLLPLLSVWVNTAQFQTG